MHIPENALKSKIPPTIDWATENGLAPKIMGAGIRNKETINLSNLSALFWFLTNIFIELIYHTIYQFLKIIIILINQKICNKKFLKY